jgi:phenylacetate-CoA ligase
MIRYRTGDITALTTEPCRCGRTSARIARLKGRADDMLVVKGVNVYPSEVEAALLSVEDLEPHYQLVIDRVATLARIEVHVEPTAPALARCGGAVADGHPELEALRQLVASRVRSTIGLSVEVRLVAPRTIPRSEGKAVRVVERS